MASAGHPTKMPLVSERPSSAAMRQPGHAEFYVRSTLLATAQKMIVLIACLQNRTDCADGNCYEGACAGDKVYSTDGTCGFKYGNRLCIGKRGDCCNHGGQCGTGNDFCGIDVCQSGNCTQPTMPSPSPLPWLTGNSTNGTCGGPNNYGCDVVYGNCCNKNGVCGSLPSDCGVGW